MKNSRVLFIIHDVYQDDNWFPMGPGYIAAVLKNADVEVKVYNQDVFHYTNDELAQYLSKEFFDIITIGFLAARFTETIIDLCQVVNKFKKDAWLVLGGHGPSPIPEYVLKTTGADIAAIGEAEETFLDLIKCKINNHDLHSINGIAFFDENNKFVETPRRKVIRNLDSLPFPEWSLFPMEQYSTCIKTARMTSEDKAFGILTSRGCINRCSFCYRMEKGIRFRSVQNIVSEMRELNEVYGITFFLMYDELFVYPRKRIFEFSDELQRNDLKIKYQCNARVDIFDDEIAQCLKESGCQFVNFGMESSSQKVLDLMNKNTTVETNIKVAEIVKRHEIGIGLNFIWGNPGDTEQSLWDNVYLIKKYNMYDQLRTIRPVTPYPGCDLYYTAIDMGLLTGPEDFFNKFKNSDRFTLNFTGIPEKKYYNLLFKANKELILDYYAHTNGDEKAANELIDAFYRLYFLDNTKFRGARKS